MRTLTHRVELRLALAALLALLFAQVGAVSHAYAHDAAWGKTTSSPVGANTHNPCGECLAFAPLLSATGGPAPLPGIAAPAPCATQSAGEPVRIALEPHLAFRSRAPPSTP